jgi:plasmid stabilization system protein ParE
MMAGKDVRRIRRLADVSGDGRKCRRERGNRLYRADRHVLWLYKRQLHLVSERVLAPRVERGSDGLSSDTRCKLLVPRSPSKATTGSC